MTLTHGQGDRMKDDNQDTPREAELPAAAPNDDQGQSLRKGHQHDECADASSAQAQHGQDRALASGEGNPT